MKSVAATWAQWYRPSRVRHSGDISDAIFANLFLNTTRDDNLPVRAKDFASRNRDQEARIPRPENSSRKWAIVNRRTTHLNHWCVLARETDLPAWRQSDGEISPCQPLSLALYPVHSASGRAQHNCTHARTWVLFTSLPRPRPRATEFPLVHVDSWRSAVNYHQGCWSRSRQPRGRNQLKSIISTLSSF